jgi:hypothetical protein
MKGISLNIWEGGGKGAQGVRFEPDIVVNQLKQIFPELVIDDVDVVTKRINWAKNEFNKKDRKTSDKFLDTIIKECKLKQPAISFKLIDKNEIAVLGVISTYSLRFFVDGSCFNVEAIPEDYVIRIKRYLDNFQCNIEEF